LVNPYWPYPYTKGDYAYNRIWPPICLANCAALLEKEHHNVEIFDAHARRIKPKQMGKHIKGYDKVFITSSPIDKWQCPNIDIRPFLETLQYIAQITGNIYVMGYHGTVEPEKILSLDRVRAIIRGEPEFTVREICRNKDLSKVKGITFKDNGRIVSTPQREPFDLKNIPVPSYHLINFKDYFYEILGRNFTLFEISRGCKFRCLYCNKVMYGGGLRSKSKEQIFEEITTAVEKYGVKTAYFIDLDFLSNRETVEELCDYLIKRKYNFKWTCQTRPDLLDIDILRKMKAAGCGLIHLGVESGLQKILDSLGRNISISKIRSSVKMCNQAGIKTLAFFLFGLPGEKEKDRDTFFDFIKGFNFDLASFHKVVPYRGSGISKDSFELNGDVDKFIRKAFIKYYFKVSYLRKFGLPTILRCLRLFYGRIRTLR